MADLPPPEDRPTGSGYVSGGAPPPKVNVDAAHDDADAEDKETEGEEEIDAATKREALHYWGRLFDEDSRCTDVLDRLLVAIAKYISANFDPNDHSDLTPTQLALFYRSVGGNYDTLFQDQPYRAIAFVYQKLGCLHSLQPRPQDVQGREAPTVPALKARGFAAWERIQLLLNPSVHAGYLQRALKKYDIVDPDTGENFPRILPREAFPAEPDPQMVKWYESSLERLRPGASGESESGSEYLRPGYSPQIRRDGSGYFAQGGYGPHNRHAPPPPGAYRGSGPQRYPSAASPRTPVEILQEGGRAVVSRVRGLWSPRGSDRDRERMDDERAGRRRSWHGIDETYENSRDYDRINREREKERRYRETQRERTPTSPIRRPARAQYADTARPTHSRRAGSSPGGGQKMKSARRPSPASPLSSSSEHPSAEEDNTPLPTKVRPRYAPRRDRGVERDYDRDADPRHAPDASSPVSESAAAAAAVAGSASPIYHRQSRDSNPRRGSRVGNSTSSASPKREYFPPPSARSHSHFSQLSGDIGRRHSSAHHSTSHHTSSQSHVTNPFSGSNLSAASANARRHHSVSAATNTTPTESPHEGVGFSPSTAAPFAAKVAAMQGMGAGSEEAGSGSSAGRRKSETDRRKMEVVEERKRDGYERRKDRRHEDYNDDDDDYRDRDKRRDRDKDPRSRSYEDLKHRRIPIREDGSSSRSRRGERERDRERDLRDREYNRRREYERERDRDYDRDLRDRDLRDRDRERDMDRRYRYVETGVDGRRYPGT